jgi:hypothetical protein
MFAAQFIIPEIHVEENLPRLCPHRGDGCGGTHLNLA